MQAIIIAGGRGTRLRPYTNILPKPLLPIGLRSILEIIIRQLKESEVQNILIAVGYLGELVEGIMGNGEKFGMNIEYSYEEEPLGTVGALGLLKEKLEENFIVTNGDILHDVNFTRLFQNHINSAADASITIYKKTHRVQLGIVEITDGKISKYVEKPTSEYFVSAGIYALNKKVIEKYVEVNKYLNFPALINIMIKEKMRIMPYYHDGLWIDLGTEKDYFYVMDNLEKIKQEHPQIPILL